MKLKISSLWKDGLQTRVALDERTVSEYADAMREGQVFPPVKVFDEPGTGAYWLADGFHRVEAAMRAGVQVVDADVSKGYFVDALRYALGCNAKHGKRVTNEDKQNALAIAWANRDALFGGIPSGALLAATCGVHRNTAAAFLAEHAEPQTPPVAPVRRQSSANAPVQVAQIVQPAAPVRKVVGTDGKSYPVRPVRFVPARPEHVVPTDRYGVEIPVAANIVFENDWRIGKVLDAISEARCALRGGDAVFAAVRQDALVQLNNAYNFVAAAAPHCVCRMCQGQGCAACHGRGWQTGEEYERNPKEFKAQGVGK